MPSRISEVTDSDTIIKQCFIYRLLHEKLAISTEQLQCELQKETEVHKGIKKTINIHKVMLEGYNLNLMAKLTDFKEL